MSRRFLSFLAGISLLVSCKAEPTPAPVVAEMTPTPTAPPKKVLPAQVKSVKITPETPRKGDRLSAEAEGLDPAGRALTFQFQWYRNGERLMGEIANTLNAELQHGEVYVVEAIPIANGETGKSRRSRDVQVLNTPPELVSTLKAGMSLDGFRFQARDADGDPIRWTLEGAPPNMTLTPDGVLHWKSSASDQAGSYNVKVMASDGVGGTVTATIPIQTTAPVIP
ncbi:MAG: Ig-like domain-containing protein [Myxococcota bacterium]